MKALWEVFGFSETPYNKKPLEMNENDFLLFTGRKDQSASFLSQFDQPNGCVLVVSGGPGIGKTSFINTQQYIIEENKSLVSQKPIPCYKRTPAQPSDDSLSIARRVVHNTLDNITLHCKKPGNKKLPDELKELSKWMSHQADDGGCNFDILGTFGFGFNNIPINVNDATLENWHEILTIIKEVCIKKLDRDGFTVIIDNVEVYQLEDLAKILMSFRDTLFDIDNIWWIVVGQANLFSELSAHDTRISERIEGAGIEIPPLSAQELHDMVQKRIRAAQNKEDAMNPLSENIHQHLYDASRGVARFVLDTANNLILRISKIANKAVSELDSASPEVLNQVFLKVLQKMLFEKQINDSISLDQLGELSIDILSKYKLNNSDISLIKHIGLNTANNLDHNTLGYDSIDEFRAGIEKLIQKKVLHTFHTNDDLQYELLNYGYLAVKLDVIDQIDF
ncbi:MAG: hypothetical protein JAY64_09385 [Candidatus Thiodiazotropha weberae]|nr:hypothetical protein [Candidatus Thiodiazotropha lotti]MCG8011900.1 hypothetical protein [Candidatus Thiodiazotropha lotti]MCW4211367.1 hypothetical protein [Candidatus Thiodiazotropha lotti]MCW4216778.1 hypothetical protein [Candidatus Thiodiazotropha lotti]